MFHHLSAHWSPPVSTCNIRLALRSVQLTSSAAQQLTTSGRRNMSDWLVPTTCDEVLLILLSYWCSWLVAANDNE